jgi:hypothetical protein
MKPTSPVLKDDLAFAFVGQRLIYDAESGKLFWREKDVSEPNATSWNTRYAGKEAGSHDHAGYVTLNINGKHYRAHRLAWLLQFGVWPDIELDHINRNRSDNRIENLRLATKAQNAINSGVPANSSCGVKGVHWHSGARKWRAKIKVNGRSQHLGYFRDRAAASAAYDEAARIHFGSFAPEVA